MAHNTYDKLSSSNGTHWHQNQPFSCLELVSTKTLSLYHQNLATFSLFSQTRNLKIKNFGLKLNFEKLYKLKVFNVKNMRIKVNFSCHFLNYYQIPLFFHFTLVPLLSVLHLLNKFDTCDKLSSCNGTHWHQNQSFSCPELVSTKHFSLYHQNLTTFSLFSQTRNVK